MNSKRYQIIFSTRLNALVVVGENCTRSGKTVGESRAGSAFVAQFASITRFVGVLALGLALVTTAFAEPMADALPVGGAVAQGAVIISQSANAMVIHQDTSKAIVNWQSFDIGAAARVNVIQPSTESVLLNRVVGNNPSQIFGSLDANGQVILINPNGILFGKDGSVNANAFTASTLDMRDADFMAGNYGYFSTGVNGEIVNQGGINAQQYVALMGAKVRNDGAISTNGGNVYLGAAEAITVPVSNSGRIKMELSPASINAAVENTQNGVIVTQGGQVYIQASSLNDAVASISSAGQIDTSGAQAGSVAVLADGGNIKVSGSIKANSTLDANKGGDIIIGRDASSGLLAKATNVSGATLESKRGFVETSGDVLATTCTRVKAGEWLLDPYNITIASGTVSGTNYSNYTSSSDSTILASDISANLTGGTSVTLATGVGGTSVGNIAVNESISKTGGGDATLTLQAHGNITVAAGKTITSDTGKLNVVFNSDSDGVGGGGIIVNAGAGITSNGGNITLGGGTALNGTGFAIADGVSTLRGIYLESATISAGGGNLVMNGQTAITNYVGSLSNVSGIYMTGSTISTTGSGTIQISGKNQNTDTQSQGFVMASGTITGGSNGAVTINGDSSGLTSTFTYIRGSLINGTVTSTGGNVSVTGFGGAGAQYDYGVDIGGSVTATGSGTVTISGTAGAGGSGGNVGVNTSAGSRVASVDGSISISGTGGNGNGVLRNHGVLIGGTNAINSTGTGSITVTGTATNSDNGFSRGVSIEAGGLNTNSGNIKIDANVPQNYQVAAYINAPISSTSGNVYIRSASSNIQNTATGTIAGNNVSIDNTGGTIDANGVITKGVGGASTWAGVIEQNGVGINGSVTAANNLNIYGNQLGTASGVSISGATTTVSGKNVTLYGNSNTGNGVLLSGATLSGQYINATGATNTGYTGFSWSGGNINTTGAGGTSTASVVKGISAASSTLANGYGAFMMYGNGATNAASGTALTLAGEATTLTTGQNIKERGILVQGGRVLTVSGDVTLDGSSKSSEGIAFGGTINIATVAGVTNKLTIKGTAAASSNASLNAVNMSGTINGNAATSSINIIGDAKNLSGTSYDNAVNISGSITGSGANVNIQSTRATITTSGAITGNNISIDNTNGSIDSSTGAITAGSATAGAATGVSIGGNVTATGNLNLYGVSSGSKGIEFVTGKGISGANIQATGKTTNGLYGVVFNGTNTVTTTGTSGDSLIKGLTTAGGTNALLAWGGLNLTAATGTTLTVWGDGTSIGDRAARFDGGGSANGAVTLKGTSNNATSLMFINGIFTANANSTLTLSGTTNGSGQAAVYFVNNGGIALNNAATLNITGQNTNASGAGTGVLIQGAGIYRSTGSSGAITITGSTSSTAAGATGVAVQTGVSTDGNIDIQGNVASASSTGVSITSAGNISSSGSNVVINIASNYGITNAGNIRVLGSTGTGSNINLTSTNHGISGAGAIGDTTNKNASITFTQSGTSTYDGAVNAANFTKAGTGSLTLDSWSLVTPVATNISNAYTVKGGGTLILSPGASYAQLNPASVNVENASIFSISTSGNGWWKNTAFNFTGGSGGGIMNLGGNPIGASSTTNTFSTTGGATNTITGLLNANNANVNFNLTAATSGTALLDGGFAAIAFTQNAQGGYGLQNASTVNMSGGGNLLFKDKVGAITFNINAGNLQIGDGSAATVPTTATLDATNLSIATGSKLTFNRAEAYTNASVITGNGSLIQAGTGVISLTGDSSTFAGATTVNSGKTLAISTGGSLGAAGSTLTLADSASSLVFTEVSGVSVVASTISGAGSVSHSGAGTGVLVANNSYSGATTVSGGTLQVGNAGATGTLGSGDVTLSNNANLNYLRSAATTIANNISGSGNVSATITGATSNLTVDHAISLTGGTVSLVTDANLLLSNLISTTNSTSSAILLNAGKATAAGTSTGGDVQISGTSALTVGTGGRATVMTGAISSSTGVTALVGSGSGNFRYNSDEVTTNYSTALGAGTYAIYREAPTATITINNDSKTYNGLSYTGGNGYTLSAGGVNGDTAIQAGASVVYGGTSQNAKNAGSYSITNTSSVSALGYNLSYVAGTLTVNQADLIVTASEVIKTYDGTLTATGLATIGVLAGAGDSVNSAGSQAFLDKNYGVGNKVVRASGVTIKDSSNADMTSNYNIVYTDNIASTINKAPLELTTSNVVKTYDGTLSASGVVTVKTGTLYTGDTLSGGVFSFTDKNYGVGNKTVTVNGVTASDGTNANNYAITYADNTTSTINKAALTASLVGLVQKDYDGTTSATNLTGSNFNLTGWVSVSGLSEGASITQTLGTYTSKNVSDNHGGGSVSAMLGLGNFTADAGTNLNNYSLPTNVTGNVGRIDPVALTINVNSSAMFVTQNPNLATDNGLSYTGFKNGEDASVLSNLGSRTYVGAANPVARSNAYASVYGLSSTPTANNGNYTINVVNGDLTVLPAAKLLITIGGKTLTYGALDATSASASADNVSVKYCFNASDCVNNIATLTTQNLGGGNWRATDITNTSITFSTLIDSTGHLSAGGYLGVGNYTYAATQTTPASTANFNGREVNGGILTVQAKTLTLSASDVTKVYDGSTNIGLTALGSNAMAGDLVTASATSGVFSSENAGSHNVNFNGIALTGRDSSNYAIASSTFSGMGAITAKPVTLTSIDVTKIYDGLLTYTTTTHELDALSAQLGVSGDSVSAATITYLDENAGTNNKSVALSNVSINDGNNGNNYLVTLAENNTSTISKANATVTANSDLSKVYNGLNQTISGFTASGLVNGETESVLSGVSASATAKNAGTYVVSASGSDANYNLSFVDGRLKINQAALQLQANGVSKVYDGTTTLVGIALTPSGVFASDDVSAVASTGAFNSKNVGSGIGFTLSGLSLSGSASSNYTLATSTLSGTGSITPKALSLLGSLAKDKVSDGNTLATVVPGSFVGLVGTETLALSATASFADSTVGANKLVLASYALADGTNGGLASNYTLADEQLYASITSNQSFINPVVPHVPTSPSQSSGSSSRIGSQQFSAEIVKPEVVAKQCSVENPEACSCQNTLLEGVQLCMTPSNDAAADKAKDSADLKLSKQ